MNEKRTFVTCMVFLRRPGEVFRTQGLGTHPFGRVPCVNEYISLESDGPHLMVTHVHHTGFGSHAAELYCTEAKGAAGDMTEFHPPPA